MPRGHARLNVLETLRAAAPWQRIRGRTAAGDRRIRIDAADFRITRHQERTQTLTIFAVDASGSSALHRLAEAKGAVELLLADCYVRRDQVAVVTFRGRDADLLLPPTRSLVRAKRALAGLPGGGGTPLAAAIDSALRVGLQSRRRGETPILVMLSDGRANVSRSGAGGREAAHADALRAARLVRQAGLGALFVDTSPRPNPLAADLAAAMDAHYIPLPYASSQVLSRIVTEATRRA
jgi:magnesium chelatase subunit D